MLTSSFYVICSVSPVLDCGHTLVGGRKVVQLVCENKGGDGKFCIMRKSHWPSTTFQVWSMNCSSTSNVNYKASSVSGQEEPFYYMATGADPGFQKGGWMADHIY